MNDDADEHHILADNLYLEAKIPDVDTSRDRHGDNNDVDDEHLSDLHNSNDNDVDEQDHMLLFNFSELVASMVNGIHRMLHEMMGLHSMMMVSTMKSDSEEVIDIANTLVLATVSLDSELHPHDNKDMVCLGSDIELMAMTIADWGNMDMQFTLRKSQADGLGTQADATTIDADAVEDICNLMNTSVGLDNIHLYKPDKLTMGHISLTLRGATVRVTAKVMPERMNISDDHAIATALMALGPEVGRLHGKDSNTLDLDLGGTGDVHKPGPMEQLKLCEDGYTGDNEMNVVDLDIPSKTEYGGHGTTYQVTGLEPAWNSTVMHTSSHQTEFEQYGNLERTTLRLKTQGGASMVAIENTYRKKHGVLYGKQVSDGVVTPTESEVGAIERILTTKRRHAHESTAKLFLRMVAKRERESNLHTEISSDSGGMPALVSASDLDESGGYLDYASETESIKIHLLLQLTLQMLV